MVTGFNLTEGLIQQHSAPESFHRGQEYYRAGAVRSVVRRGGVIEAEVEGSRPWPYHVCVCLDVGGVASAACTRPLRAAVLAFRERPALTVYLSARELAGPGWDSLRDELLTGLRAAKPPLPAGPVEVFLHEGLMGDAMAAVKGSWDYRLIERVAEAAIETHPDWVIETCRSQAEAIMHPGTADLYGTAVRWLGYAREAYRVAGCEHEWLAYLQELIVRHARKYKLRPLLEALRR